VRYIPVKRPRLPDSPWARARQPARPTPKTVRKLVEDRECDIEIGKKPAFRPIPKGRKIEKTEFRSFLRSIGFASYDAYLASELWMKIRKKVMARTNGLCSRCWNRASQVHHYAYTEDNLKGENLVGLEALCRQCHKVEHSGCDLDARKW
jgi:hypothetical protein